MNRSGGATRWARELDSPLRRSEPWTPERIEQALGPLLEGRRMWPSRREFEQAGLGGLYAASRHGEGHPALAARYGLLCCSPPAAPRNMRGAAA